MKVKFRSFIFKNFSINLIRELCHTIFRMVYIQEDIPIQLKNILLTINCFPLSPFDINSVVDFDYLIIWTASVYNVGDLGSIPGSGRSAEEGNGNPLQYYCLEKSHGQMSLISYSPGGRKESGTTEWLHFHFSLSISYTLLATWWPAWLLYMVYYHW